MVKKINCKFTKLFLMLCLVSFLAACATVPGTGRKQLSLVNESEINAMASQQYRGMVADGPLSKNKKDTQMLNKVGLRISKAAEEFLIANGMANEVKNYNWEFNLIVSDSVNAFCMPGGKIAFFTGILPVTQNEVGIATIMGHEVAHAIARHGVERASHQVATGTGANILAVGLGLSETSPLTAGVVMAAYGVGSEVGVLLPFSRAHESEADRIGLTLMAMAGYQPKEAVGFWQRMEQLSAGAKKGPGFLSTHPTDQKRIDNIQKFLPEAEAKFKPHAGK